MNANNIGDYYEAQVAKPGDNVAMFEGQTNQTLARLSLWWNNRIFTDVHPFFRIDIAPSRLAGYA